MTKMAGVQVCGRELSKVLLRCPRWKVTRLQDDEVSIH